MARDNDAWEDRQRWRWEKPNMHCSCERARSDAKPVSTFAERALWLRENAHLYRKPAPFDRSAWLKEREAAAQKAAESPGLALTPEDIAEYRAGIARIRSEIASIRRELLRRKAGFDPAQPRVPAGNPDGGQWTGENSDPSPRFAASDLSSSSQDIAVVRRNEAECDAQYERDIQLCRILRTQLCYAQAAERYAACLGGRQIPVLRF